MADTPERDGPAARPDRVARATVAVLGTLLTLASLGWAADVYRILLGLAFSTEQFLAGIVTLTLPLLYLSARAGRRAEKARVPWYDWAAAALGFACGAYMTYYYVPLSQLLTERPADGLVVGSLILLLVLEGLRRTTGWALFVIVIVFLLYTQVADLMPGQLQGMSAAPGRTVYYIVWDTGSMLGLPLNVACTIVIAFIFFGNLLAKSGGSAFFTDLSVALMGRFRGGSAKIAVVASGLFGSISGSAVSNVVSTGVITIPLMQRGGYTAQQAGAIEAVASTGGQLMPPIMGAAAFLMATFLEVDYAEVVLAALVPSLLYYGALFILVDLEAARAGISRVDGSLIPRLLTVLGQGWHYPLAFVVLIGALFWLNVAPETAALYAAGTIAVSGLLFGYKGARMHPREILRALRTTGVASIDILMICAAAGAIIGVLNLTGLGHALAIFLVDAAGGSLFLLLLLAAVVCIILGMGMPTAGVYVLLATLVAPAIIKAGVDPMVAHLYVMYFGMMSMITPPVAIAAFTAASLAQTNPMATGFAAVRFGWVAYVVPFLFVASPSLLLKGDVVTILVAVATAVAGVWLISAAVTGYLFRRFDPVTRVLTGIAGFSMLLPANAMPAGLWTDVFGLALGAGIVVREVVSVRLAAGGKRPRSRQAQAE